MKLDFVEKIILVVFLLLLFSMLTACGGGKEWTQCSPCEEGCEEQPLVNTPELEAL